ncbi:hypothetical protein [Sphaerisporangium flaviroseum]|uniref:hypothetical protein n=1 Tax=Sphaerisporangium flaviroseum TaxID=509199 RepID=UPI0031E9A1BD
MHHTENSYVCVARSRQASIRTARPSGTPLQVGLAASEEALAHGKNAVTLP